MAVCVLPKDETPVQFWYPAHSESATNGCRRREFWKALKKPYQSPFYILRKDARLKRTRPENAKIY